MSLREFVHGLVVGGKGKAVLSPKLYRPLLHGRGLPDLLLPRPNLGIGYNCKVATIPTSNPFERLRGLPPMRIWAVNPIKGGQDAEISLRSVDEKHTIVLTPEEQWGLKWELLPK